MSTVSRNDDAKARFPPTSEAVTNLLELRLLHGQLGVILLGITLILLDLGRVLFERSLCLLLGFRVLRKDVSAYTTICARSY